MKTTHGSFAVTIPWDGTHECGRCGHRWREAAEKDVVPGVVEQVAAFEECPSCGGRLWTLFRGYRDGSVGTEGETWIGSG